MVKNGRTDLQNFNRDFTQIDWSKIGTTETDLKNEIVRLNKELHFQHSQNVNNYSNMKSMENEVIHSDNMVNSRMSEAFTEIETLRRLLVARDKRIEELLLEKHDLVEEINDSKRCRIDSRGVSSEFKGTHTRFIESQRQRQERQQERQRAECCIYDDPTDEEKYSTGETYEYDFVEVPINETMK